MLRRIIAELFEQVTGAPAGPRPSMPRPRGESLRTVGERLRRWPEPEEAERMEARRAPAPAPEPDTELDRGLAGELGSPAAVRRAFVLMEILGPPVSLRDRRDLV